MYTGHHHEVLPPGTARVLQKHDPWELKVALWNAFADSGLLGINEDDCSLIPHILPASYLPVIERACRGITLFALRLLSLPDAELTAILPSTPIRDYLIEELGVLRYRPQRLTGSFRFDLAVIGPPGEFNPPKLLEVNDIGFDGIGRSSYIQETLLWLVPGLRKRVSCLDTAAAEVSNLRRLGRRLVRFQYDSYNWEEQVLAERAREVGLRIRMVSPSIFGADLHEECTDLTRQSVGLKNGRITIGSERRPPDAVQMGYSFDLKDYREKPRFFRDLVRSRTPQYGPFISGLVSSKTILLLFSDAALRRRFLGRDLAERVGRSILPAASLRDMLEPLRHTPDRYVLKHVDSMGGEQVFVGQQIAARLRRIPAKARHRWVVQQRVKLNTIDVHGILSRPRRVLTDLGAFVQYDWDGRRFLHFGLGGFISRATNRSLKVNVSGGGIQVPVMFDRAC